MALPAVAPTEDVAVSPKRLMGDPMDEEIRDRVE